MAKEFHCAQCGVKLDIMQRAVPQKGIVLNLVKPHSCEETKEEDRFGLTEAEGKPSGAVEKKTKLDTLFSSFDFVQKLDKAVETEPLASGPGDLRPKSSRREELPDSSAPLNVLERARREAGLATPARDMEEPDERDT